MTTSPNYIAVSPDGTHRPVPPTYEGIKDGLGGATFDTVLCMGQHYLFVDDEGMLNGSMLNVPGSIMAGQPLYGPVVLTGGVDDEGETMLPDLAVANHLMGLAHMWSHVVKRSLDLGQDVLPVAKPETLPPPEIISLTDAEFEAWLGR